MADEEQLQPGEEQSQGAGKAGQFAGENGGAWTAETHLANYPDNFNKGMACFIVNEFCPENCLEFGSGLGHLSKYICEAASPQQYLCIEPEVTGPNYDSQAGLRLVNIDIFRDQHPGCINRKFDLVISIEVAEHIERDKHEVLFDFVVSRASKWIVFSGARIGQGGIGHIAERDEEDWKSEFARRGMHYEATLTRRIREASDEKNINHRRNVMVFRRPEHYLELDILEASATTHLDRIRKIVESRSSFLVGNLFYVNMNDAENGMPCESLRIKRDNFLQLIKGKQNALMVGFNAGHSTLLALLANPGVTLTVVDLCEFPYARDCYRYLDEQFPGRIEFIEGNSIEVLPGLKGNRYDFVHLDAGKDVTFEKDIENLRHLVADEHVLLIDDTQNEGIRASLNDLVQSGVIDDTAYPQYGHKLRNRMWRHSAHRIGQHGESGTTGHILGRLAQLFDNDEFPSLYTSRNSNGSIVGEARANSLIHLVKDVTSRELSGDFVECGVAAGHSALMAMMSAMSCGNARMRFHLYDTFEGFSFTLPDEKDLQDKPIKDYDLGKYATHLTSRDEVLRKVQQIGLTLDRVVCVEGRVEDTLREYWSGEISILRLDMGLYEPTRHSLDRLYPSLQVGGHLIIDDYGHWLSRRNAVDEFFQAHSLDLSDLVQIDYTCYVYQKLSAE